MVKMLCYAIRHVATGELMPQLKERKGYSWWNPAHASKLESKTTGLPRLFSTERIARQAITGWITYPNASVRGYSNHLGEDDYDIRITDDGRKKEDLEVIPVLINLGEEDGQPTQRD